MENDNTLNVAKNILEDRSGADYYADNKVLADYLAGALGISEERAAELAEGINSDRKGANYYQDVKILAQYIG